METRSDKKPKSSDSMHLIVICAHHLDLKYGHVQDGLGISRRFLMCGCSSSVRDNDGSVRNSIHGSDGSVRKCIHRSVRDSVQIFHVLLGLQM
jgi:hypothetical protein